MSRATKHRLTRAVVDAYAQIACDHNPIHISDDAARALGFESAIAHGMLTLGWALSGAGVCTWGRSSAEPAPMVCSAKFVAPAAVGTMVELVPLSEDDSAPENVDSYTVHDEIGAVVLRIQLDESPSAGSSLAELLTIAQDAEPVATVVVQVDESIVLPFARALNTPEGTHTSAQAAHEAGLPGLPIVPSLAFALPALGFVREEAENAGLEPPDPVTDCQRWARTEAPVVHAGQRFGFTRPLWTGETLRARTFVVGRREREGSGGRRLEFTDVRTVFETRDGEAIAASEMGLVVFG